MMTTAGQLYKDLNAAGIRVCGLLSHFHKPQLMLVMDSPLASIALLERHADIEKHSDMLIVLALGQGFYDA